MAETSTTSAVEGIRTLPPDAFFELDFDPQAGGGHVSVGATGGPIDATPGEGPEDPPFETQNASVKVTVFRRGQAPLVTKLWSLFPLTGQLVFVLGFAIPQGQANGWRCRLENVGPTSITCRAKVLYTVPPRPGPSGASGGPSSDIR